ncbi:MAG: tetratricopeptide repeat protein [Candidatus Solibacter usitatus]|nr:tetratricopeptide repeat protein [Candidatus Solibacter usitatus]
MPDPATKRSYSRDEVCRLLGLREATIEQWESHGFLPRAETYAFRDLVALKALRELKHKRIPPQRICLILKSLRAKLTHIVDPLSELKIFSDGRRLAVQVDGAKMEPISGQLLLDFDREELRRLLQFPGKRADDTLAQAVVSRMLESAKWFDRGVELEHTGAPPDQIIAAYRKALEHDPDSAAPHVNLGTVFFHQKNWRDAEAHYRAAIQLNPDYALAHFNLGNLHDELNDPAAALASYLRALEIQPTYADAHYNVALLCQGKGDTMRAVRHWRAYLKLDPAGYWASIARRELSRLRQETIVGGAP